MRYLYACPNCMKFGKYVEHRFLVNMAFEKCGDGFTCEECFESNAGKCDRTFIWCRDCKDYSPAFQLPESWFSIPGFLWVHQP